MKMKVVNIILILASLFMTACFPDKEFLNDERKNKLFMMLLLPESISFSLFDPFPLPYDPFGNSNVDLAVTSFTLPASNVEVGTAVTIDYSIENLGTEDSSGPIVTYIYFSPSTDTCTGSYSNFVESIDQTIPAGGSINRSGVEITIPNMPVGTYYPCIFVYSYSSYYELDMDNNTFSQTASVNVTIAADEFEPDDGWLQASLLASDETPQIHSIHAAGDVDFVRFEITAAEIGIPWYIVTYDDGGCFYGVDTEIYLYDTDGATLLMTDNDSGFYLCSLIQHTFTSSGSYYVKVIGRNGTTGIYSILTGPYLY